MTASLPTPDELAALAESWQGTPERIYHALFGAAARIRQLERAVADLRLELSLVRAAFRAADQDSARALQAIQNGAPGLAEVAERLGAKAG